MRSLDGITEEYRRLNVLNYEMECGTLLKMAGVYQFAANHNYPLFKQPLKQSIINLIQNFVANKSNSSCIYH
jgi:uridine phosphorylase